MQILKKKEVLLVNKTELVAAMAENSGLSKKDAEKACFFAFFNNMSILSKTSKALTKRVKPSRSVAMSKAIHVAKKGCRSHPYSRQNRIQKAKNSKSTPVFPCLSSIISPLLPTFSQHPPSNTQKTIPDLARQTLPSRGKP